MRFDILTLFPAMFQGPLTESILKRAQQAHLIDIHLHDIRAYATDKHHTADDAPYGGGAGMVMKAAPLAAAIRSVLAMPASNTTSDNEHTSVIFLSPDGEPLTQLLVTQLAHAYTRLVFVCGHYEGIDERVRQTLIHRDISIGDYVLTGGELAAMVVIDAVSRHVPGVIDAASVADESHNHGLLEYPHYTRPAIWEGMPIPDVLLSGHHAQIAAWRHQQCVLRTWQRRPDLLLQATACGLIGSDDMAYLAQQQTPSADEP